MRKIIILIIALFIVVTDINSQNSWFWQNPSPTGYRLYCVKFLNSNTGFAVGYNGSIARTLDGGSNWSLLSSITTRELHGIDFLNSNSVMVVGLYGSILKSTDLGNNWTDLSVSTSYHFWDIDFADASTGTIVGNKILRTSNGGLNWVEQYSNTSPIWGVQFIDANTGTAVGTQNFTPLILRTTNGGINWIQQFSPLNLYPRDVFFTDINTGYISMAGQRAVLKTTNGGNNWLISDYGGSGSGQLYSVSFMDNNTGVVTGDRGRIGRTTNAGLSWNYIFLYPSESYAWFYNVSFSDQLTGSIAGESGLLFRTTDGGLSWFSQNKETINILNGVYFLNNNRGFVVGNNGTIMRTTNGGQNWILQFSNTANNIRSVYFHDANNGIVAGDLGLVLKTSDGGLSWIQQPSGTNNNLISVSFANVNNGIICGSNGTIIHTTNGGVSWNIQNSGVTRYLTKVFMTDVNNAYIVGIGSRLKTVNGGATWSVLYNCIGQGCEYLADVQFFNANTGYVSGGGFKKTTDGGINFTNYSGPISYAHFIDEMNGIGVHYQTVSRTTNGGINWISNSLINGSYSQFYDVHMSDLNTAVIVGSFGAIMRTTTGGSTFIEPVSNVLPAKFSLTQNYPNPFNPKTIINYQLSTFNIVSLKVFDALGKEVATLVNQKQNAGSYEVEFNGEDLPSGVYFYKLEAGDFSETKRMILLK